MPAGLALSEDYIARDLRRRQGGHGRGGRQKIESDRAEIVSGVRHGLTLGSPIALVDRESRLGELARGHGRRSAGRSRSNR